MEDTKIYQALVVEETGPGQFTRQVTKRSLTDLPQGDVLVRVKYSSLNYKDALSASGNKGVTRKYPHTPGIDAAGVVEESSVTDFRPGDEVVVVANELGVNTPGGYGQYIRTPADWLVHLPRGLTLRQSMAYGTAGFTAALSVERMEQAGLKPEAGEVLVTGATGGVGSIAVGILAKEGFKVVASTGKQEHNRLLMALGAQEVITRDAINDASGKPLLHTRWAGVVDTVGGNYLSTAIRSTMPGGVVTTCGNVASAELPITVYPFILRGVSLLGIDALLPSQAERTRLWKKLASDWKLDVLDSMVREVKLSDLEAELQRMLAGGGIGRVVVNMDEAETA